jgi:hypothetical protein
MNPIRIISALLVGTSLQLLAQEPPQGPPPDPVVVTLDKDHDQKLSSREIRNALKSLLKLDKNKDKALNAEELKPDPPKGQRRRQQNGDQPQDPGPPASAITRAIDLDGDGELSTEELKSASESLLKLDDDGNGKLDSDEAEISGSGRGGPPGGGGGEGPSGGGQGGGPPPPDEPQRSRNSG